MLAFMQRRVLLNTLVKPLPTSTMAQTLLRNYIAPPRVPANRRGPKVDWSVMHNKAQMDAGLSLWSRGEFSGTKKNGGLRKFCKEQDLPYSTFFDRLRKLDPFAVPTKVRPSLFCEESRSAIVDTVAALDHLNKGRSDAVRHTHTHAHTQSPAYSIRF
jgi:hypothetical protein